ncbi:MAG: formate--phosphoribosylaminoimidazolecarboxamide ligase family protein [Candidatus Hydrothermarchaeales archaeon]
MITREEIFKVIEDYKKEDISIGVIGSHSALEIGHGVKQEGLKTVVVCQKGREKAYTKYYKNLFDEALVLDRFKDMVEEENQERLRELNTIFVPSRSFSVYVGYDTIENEFLIPMLGNRFILRMEERTEEKNQYDLLRASGIKMPKIFGSSEEIDRLVIVKVLEKDRKLERAFFYATTPKEFEEKANERLKKGIIDEKDLSEAIIEEYVLGAKFNANYFWSPISDELDLLGFDRRIQTDIDGILDLPADEQLELGIPTQNIEIGHMGATMRESQIEKIFNAGERFVDTCKREVPPGMIGLFALQGAMDKNLDFYVFDVSPRIPGCPCVEPTSPYMKYKYNKVVGPGRRVAMETISALKADRLKEIVT